MAAVLGKRPAIGEAAGKVKIVWSDAALDDLEAIRAYYFEKTNDAATGERVGQAILAATAALARFPASGHIGVDGSREWLVNRYPQYLLIYDFRTGSETAEAGVAEAGVVEILGIHHQKRDVRASIHALD